MKQFKVEKIEKSFAQTKILKDISFSLQKGQTLSILGSSGSGKTTLLRCLNGLEKADAGKIYLDDTLIYDYKTSVPNANKAIIRSTFSLVFQQFHLFPQYTALENVTLATKLKNNDPLAIEKGKELLKDMGLEDKMDFYPYQLSGGQQQRVAIARALSQNPEILCFDEPTSALDPELTREVLRSLQKLSTQNRTMIIVTHEIAFAKKISDYVLFMDDGQIIEYGTPEEVISSPKQARTKEFLSNLLT